MKALLIMMIVMISTVATVNATNANAKMNFSKENIITVGSEDCYNVDKPMNIGVGDPNRKGAMKGNISKVRYEKSKRVSTINAKKINLHGFIPPKGKNSKRNFSKAKHYRKNFNRH